jgi:hypothetical protein
MFYDESVIILGLTPSRRGAELGNVCPLQVDFGAELAGARELVVFYGTTAPEPVTKSFI